MKAVLLYGSETWRTTKSNMKRVQTFINRCLRTILRIFWPNVIRNDELWRATNQYPVEDGNQTEEIALDWTHHEARRLHPTPVTTLEPTRNKESQTTQEHMATLPKDRDTGISLVLV